MWNDRAMPNRLFSTVEVPQPVSPRIFMPVMKSIGYASGLLRLKGSDLRDIRVAVTHSGVKITQGHNRE